jgi:hypothetical protein
MRTSKQTERARTKGFKTIIRRLFRFSVSGLLLTGCAANPTKPMNSSDRIDFEQANNAVVVRYAHIPANIIWGLNGRAVVDWPEDLDKEYLQKNKLPPGYIIMQRHNIPDPVKTFSDYLLEGMKDIAGFQNLTIIDKPMALPVNDDFSRYKEQYTQPYVIEFRPVGSILGWTFAAQVFSTTTYKFSNINIVKIIRQSDSKEVWSGQCYVSGQTDDELNVSFDEMVGKDNPKVKAVIDSGIRKCAKDMIRQYQG